MKIKCSKCSNFAKHENYQLRKPKVELYGFWHVPFRDMPISFGRFPQSLTWTWRHSFTCKLLGTGGNNEKNLWRKSQKKSTTTFCRSRVKLRCSFAHKHTCHPIWDSNPRFLDHESAAQTTRSCAFTKVEYFTRNSKSESKPEIFSIITRSNFLSTHQPRARVFEMLNNISHTQLERLYSNFSHKIWRYSFLYFYDFFLLSQFSDLFYLFCNSSISWCLIPLSSKLVRQASHSYHPYNSSTFFPFSLSGHCEILQTHFSHYMTRKSQLLRPYPMKQFPIYHGPGMHVFIR